MTIAKPVRKRDPKFLAWVRTQPCVVSGQTSTPENFVAIEAHHVRKSGHGGTGTKPDDSRAVPLRAIFHREYHDIGKEAFELRYGVDLELEIVRLNREYAKQTREPKRPRPQTEKRFMVILNCNRCTRNHPRIPWSKRETWSCGVRNR